MAAKVISATSEFKQLIDSLKSEGKRIGVVPTMGALHAGHISLADRSVAQTDVTIATIFVNPSQFAPSEDLDKYPRTLDADVEMLSAAGVEFVFAPTNEDMYPEGFSTWVQPPDVAKQLEGEHRPTHFQGVTTIVLKLLNMTGADYAYFGQKDYQQAAVIKTMVADLNIRCEIVVCPIIRDPDGLALSSRNRYLSNEEREKALALSQALRVASELIEDGEVDTHVVMNEMKQALIDGGVDSIDYAIIAGANDLKIREEIQLPVVCLVAAHVGSTRLIDNCVFD